MRDAGIDLFLEIVDVIFQRGRLRVLLRIAGSVDLEIRALLANVGSQIAGVIKDAGRLGTFHAIATQGEHAGNLGFVKHVECLIDIILIEVLCGQVGHTRYAVFAHGMRNARGERPVG